LDWKILRSSESALGLAEGARFELAVHGVDAGFQDRFSARTNTLTTTAG
jgi:hypothetical protein